MRFCIFGTGLAYIKIKAQREEKDGKDRGSGSDDKRRTKGNRW
jgi:hypothetical protein